MEFRKFLSIFLIILAFYITISSARKTSNRSKQGNSETEVKHSGEGESLSTELQQLKDLASKETELSITSPKRPKHRRKNKHHQRNPHHRRTRLHKKKRTRPTDILKAEDDVVVNKTEIQLKQGNPPGKSNNRSRGTRHLGIDETWEPRSHHHRGHNHPHSHNHHHHHRGRRLRDHHHHSKHTRFSKMHEGKHESHSLPVDDSLTH